MAVRLPIQHFWVGNLQKTEKITRSPGRYLGGLFSFTQISERRQQEHAKHNHFSQRKLHQYHPRSGGDTFPPKSAAP